MAIGPGNLRERNLKKLEELIDNYIRTHPQNLKIFINCYILPYWSHYKDDIVSIYKKAGWTKVYFYDDDYNVFLVLER